MPRLLYFNPENDLALAANDAHYTPPASALQMATDLQRLPLRWAQPDDLILLRDGSFMDVHGTVVDRKALNSLLSTFNSSTRQLVNSSTCQLVNSSTCQLFFRT